MRKYTGRKGQLPNIPLGVMLFLMCFITAVVFIEPLKIVINTAREPSRLDCTNTTISVGQKMTCIVVDWSLPFFILACFAVAISWIGIRRYQEIS